MTVEAAARITYYVTFNDKFHVLRHSSCGISSVVVVAFQFNPRLTLDRMSPKNNVKTRHKQSTPALHPLKHLLEIQRMTHCTLTQLHSARRILEGQRDGKCNASIDSSTRSINVNRTLRSVASRLRRHYRTSTAGLRCLQACKYSRREQGGNRKPPPQARAIATYEQQHCCCCACVAAVKSFPYRGNVDKAHVRRRLAAADSRHTCVSVDASAASETRRRLSNLANEKPFLVRQQ